MADWDCTPCELRASDSLVLRVSARMSGGSQGREISSVIAGLTRSPQMQSLTCAHSMLVYYLCAQLRTDSHPA
jgi:hypothetical protein